jgi:hypothetical protein
MHVVVLVLVKVMEEWGHREQLSALFSDSPEKPGIVDYGWKWKVRISI